MPCDSTHRVVNWDPAGCPGKLQRRQHGHRGDLENLYAGVSFKSWVSPYQLQEDYISQPPLHLGEGHVTGFGQ